MRIFLRQPHASQIYVRQRMRRFNALRCGRRWGKTDFGLTRCCDAPTGLLAGFPVAWFAPTYKYLDEVWDKALILLRPVVKSKDKTDKRIKLSNGASLDFWTLDDVDAGRSRKYGHVVIDEAAMVRRLRDAWQKSIRPTLTDFRGSADFLSTPKGRDFFAELCERDGEEEWAGFHLPTSSNPFIDPREIESARLELPTLVFQQEYLADLVDFAGSAVKREWLRYGSPLDKWTEDQLITCIGGDLASSQSTHADYTTAVVLSRDPDGFYWVRYVERGRLTFRDTIVMFARLATNWKARMVLIEEVAYQSAAVQELLASTPLAIRGYKPDKDKFMRFLPVQARFQRKMILFAERLDAAFEGELLSFTGAKRRVLVGEETQEHDDYVDALVYAYIACNELSLAQPEMGVGDRLSVGGAVSTGLGFGSVRITPRG